MSDFKVSSKTFFINAIGDVGGPKIFGSRLKHEFERAGWVFDSENPKYNLCFVSGRYKLSSVNVVRLDGLYFDTDNTLGNTAKLNIPIHRTYSAFDKIIFQSEWSRRMFTYHFGGPYQPFKIIHNGVSFDLIKKSSSKYKFPFDKTLITSAKWRRHKRLEETVAGFRKINNPNIGLAILGKHDIANLPNNVISLGNVPPGDTFKYLKAADAFVSMSWLDSCPNTVVEALACGLPVLSSHNGGTPELVQDDGHIIHLEEDFNLECTTLYSPPKVDTQIITNGMKDILDWNKPVNRPDLDIRHTAKAYMDFIS